MAEVVTKQPIILTDGAKAEVKRLLGESNIPEGNLLRIGVKGGGCAGFSYILGFDVPKEGDEVFEMDDVKVIVNKAHQIYLSGTVLDFEQGLSNRGFTFTNPNAESTCGCGTSFSS